MAFAEVKVPDKSVSNWAALLAACGDELTLVKKRRADNNPIGPKDLVHFPELLKSWLPRLIKEEIVDLLDGGLQPEDVNSMVCRCIEHNLDKSLRTISELFSTGQAMRPSKNLTLRWIANPRIYVYASLHGWKDPEVEKHIRLIQRWWRARGARRKRKCLCAFRREYRYFGPSVLRYSKKCGEFGRYYGWRHVLHFLRWNRCKAFQLFRDLMSLDRWGDCAWQAYVDTLGEKEGSVLHNHLLWRGGARLKHF